ncbi:Para-hydroxybenzoate--polyprenyltransferase, mitochondrial precursor (PHB:polyprenyltransferase) [Paramarasmius palmivorus]|uniref:Para-hydroxybenzoate--polyprenyltransferase, mitochondrial (PHB:polyprenyltransferase) n=1 Tax=Paramarasmius palmivorus TaxID=297713 RepID=A0AAW0DWF5_9AGAR
MGKNLDVKSSYKVMTFYRSFFALLSPPSRTEIQACWELCRLHNNIGFWVVWLPSAWSIAMLYHSNSDISWVQTVRTLCAYVPLCFGIKSLIMTIDDILDYDIDGKVERTKNRCIPRGAISPQRSWVFFACQVVIGVYAAFKFLSNDSLRVSMVVWPLYIIYPTCKRWMYFAPIPLGLMFNVGVFMGWSDLNPTGEIDWERLIPIYIGACLWTFTYETVYQHQDKVDDAKIGIYSPALFFGTSTIPICIFTAVSFLGLLCYGGYLNNQGVFFYAITTTAGVRLLQTLVWTDVDQPDDCKHMFLKTPQIGRTIFLGVILDAVANRLYSGIPL